MSQEIALVDSPIEQALTDARKIVTTRIISVISSRFEGVV